MKIFTAFVIFLLSFSSSFAIEICASQRMTQVNPDEITHFISESTRREFGEIKCAFVIWEQIGILVFVENGVENLYTFSIPDATPVATEYATENPETECEIREKIRFLEDEISRLRRGKEKVEGGKKRLISEVIISNQFEIFKLKEKNNESNDYLALQALITLTDCYDASTEFGEDAYAFIEKNAYYLERMQEALIVKYGKLTNEKINEPRDFSLYNQIYPYEDMLTKYPPQQPEATTCYNEFYLLNNN